MMQTVNIDNVKALNIHNVKALSIGQIEDEQLSDGEKYRVHKLTVRTDDGSTIELNLFANLDYTMEIK